MIIKRLISVIAAVMISIVTSLTCFAESIKIVQANAKDDTIDVYLSGDIMANDISCAVSNQPVEIVNRGLLYDKDVTIRTTILVDISTSINRNDGQIKVVELLNNLIENISKKEEYRILTFGDKIEELQGFTSDRYDLSKSIKDIVFNGQGTTMYDAIFSTLPESQKSDSIPCFYRTIVISDGEDLSQSYITKEEVYSALQTNTYPVDTILVSSSQISQGAKDMMTISRISGGNHYSINDDVSSICSSISPNKIYWLRLSIPESLLDGSVRYITVIDGNSEKSEIAVKVSTVIKTSDEESAASTVQAESSQVGSSQVESSASSTYSEITENEEKTGVLPLTTIIIFGAVLIAVIVAAVLVAFLTKRKKPTNSGTIGGGGETVIIPTRREQHPDQKKGNYPSIRLRNISDPDMVWELDLTKVLLIGRDEACNVHLTEEHVARQQCKIYVDANGVITLENLSHSNITELNGTAIKFPQPIKRGDKINCGNVTLMVDYIRIDVTSNIVGNDSMFLGV